MESSLSSNDDFSTCTSKSSIIELIEEFHGSLNTLQPCEAANKFIQILDHQWQAKTAVASERERVASTVLWQLDTTLPQLQSASSEVALIETVLPVLQCTCITNLAELHDLSASSDDSDAAILLLLAGCTAVVQSCHQLVVWVENRTASSAHSCLPSFVPATLLSLLHAPLRHCHLNGGWYEDREGDVKESYYTLLTTALDAATALLSSLTSVCAAAATPVAASMLLEVSAMCRVLSSLSHMKGVVGGWRSITAVCTALKGTPEAQGLLSDGLDVEVMVTQLTCELQEGLELLYSLLLQLHPGEEEKSSQETVVRRVVRMCTMCSKVAHALADTFLGLCGARVVRAVLQFCLTLSRCCVCVSQLEVARTAGPGPLVLGEGQSAPLVLALQLLQAALAAHPHYSRALADSAVAWVDAVRDLEALYLATQREVPPAGGAVPPASSWCSTCAGPLLLLHHAALVLPDVLAHQREGAPGVRQLPCVVVAVVLLYVPYCGGVLRSGLSVRWERRDGGAAERLSLYTATVVAASVATTLVSPELWPLLQRLLSASVCRQPVLQGSCPSGAVAAEVWAACCALHTAAVAGGGGDVWWTRVLAADLIVFVARVGSGELCKKLYSSLCRAASRGPPSLGPQLALLLLRLQPCLLQHDLVTHWDTLPLLIRCHLSSAVVFDAGKTCPPEAKERCHSCLVSVCGDAEVSIFDLLSCRSSAGCGRLLLQLGERLQCLHAALSCRSAAGDPGPACVAAAATALARLWQRWPRQSMGGGAGAGLLALMCAVTARLSDLFSDHQLLTVLSVCLRCVESEASRSSTGGWGLEEAVVKVWESLSQRRFATSSLTPITDTLAGLCAVVVSEDRDPWLAQAASRCFVTFAQRTPHKQIVAAILQRCAADVKSRLQNFVLGKPHPAPGSGPSARDDVNVHSPPLFLFHQHCVINSKISCASKLSCSSSPSCQNKDGDEQENCHVRNEIEDMPSSMHDTLDLPSATHHQELGATLPNKRPLPDQDSVFEDISRNLSLCRDLIESNKVKLCVGGELLQEPLICSKKLLRLLQDAFTGPSKKIKADASHS